MAVLRDLTTCLKLRTTVQNFLKEHAAAPRLTAYCARGCGCGCGYSGASGSGSGSGSGGGSGSGSGSGSCAVVLVVSVTLENVSMITSPRACT